MVGWRIYLFLLSALLQVLRAAALTNADDFAALKSLKGEWRNVPPNWVGDDPCGEVWEGITCNNDRVISITLASINLSGNLSPDIGRLSELQTLDLSYNEGIGGRLPSSIGDLTNLSSLILVGCGLTGSIPTSIGSLQKLVYLSLNSNNLDGEIPASIGRLSNLHWLDLSGNQLSGSIPVSNGRKPGLDMLVNTKHFHFGGNLLSGRIPSQLFSSKMKLIHLLLENNQLIGSIPSTLGLVQNLTVVRLDKNSLSGPVPENLNLTFVEELFLANNNLTGLLPNLTGMHSLNYLDISNNPFDATDFPPWFSSLKSLTSLIMESTNVQGQIPVSLFSLLLLQTLMLKNNRINGTLNIGSSYSKQLQLIDLQNNNIDKFAQRAGYSVQNIILVGNPICDVAKEEENYCTIPYQRNSSYSTPAENCTPPPCNSELEIPSPTCKCAIPYSGNLYFRAPSFSNFENHTLFRSFEQKMTDLFISYGQPVDSISVGNLAKNIDNYFVMSLQVFPSGQQYFNRTGISGIGFMLSNQTFKPPNEFGPYFFIGEKYPLFIVVTERSHNSSSSKTVIIGAAVGGSVLVLLSLIAGVYAFRQKRRATRKSNPFASWDRNSDSGGVPQFKEVRCFSFEEIKKCTNNFSETSCVGRGGYGKVYRGTLPDGQLVAIKRAEQGSTQGRLEFKTEIELLSRVHHKNVVGLVGFCFDRGEQMLIYEYISNGTLKDGLTGKTTTLDWMRRLRIALGAARGLQYLHDLANPPIIHRDIKSNNILLDEHLNAKVADFGLSKPMGEPERSFVITQVKGTVGYMDPEYYMTQRLTEKSDVYSFGVLLLEILTSRTPILKGKYIVNEVKEAMDKTKNLYNLDAIVDPIVASNMTPRSIERFVDLALRCVEGSGPNRPAMGEVVKEMENIMQMAGLNPNAESASTSDNFGGLSKGCGYPHESLFSQGGHYSTTVLEGR